MEAMRNDPSKARATRRILLRAAGLLLASPAFAAAARAAAAAGASVEELAADTIRRAARRESSAHLRYVAFARRAWEESYPGIAYLFTALGTSELIHAQNYNRLLSRIGEATVRGDAPPRVGDTKRNLIAAAEGEIATIDSFYPSVLEQIARSDATLARRDVLYSWESHRQHRELIETVLDYAPAFFGIVASRIEDGVDTFHVCDICGSTIREAPKSSCEICGHPASHYSEIPQRAFLDPGAG